MLGFDLLQLVSTVKVDTTKSGEKIGTITLTTIDPEDVAALVLLSRKTIIKVRYEYPDEDGPVDPEEVAAEAKPKAKSRHKKNRRSA